MRRAYEQRRFEALFKARFSTWEMSQVDELSVQFIIRKMHIQLFPLSFTFLFLQSASLGRCHLA